MLLKYLLLLFCTGLSADSARILGIFDFPSKSHHIVGSALMKALAEKGHKVTVLSPYPLKTPMKNYEDITLKEVIRYKDEHMMSSIVTQPKQSFSAGMSNMIKQKKVIQEMVLNQTFEQLLKPGRKFDLVIQNWFFNDAYLGIADYFKAHVIAFSSSGSNFITNSITGSTNPYSYVPNVFSGFPSEMTFLQRVINTVSTIMLSILECTLMQPSHESIYRQYFPNAPPLHELKYNISLVLLNSHFSIESPRPYVPTMIQVGGLHLEEPKPLTGELKTFMDAAKEGVLYFSLGSNVKSADLPKEKMEAILKTFSRLPVKVLWKFESEDVPNLPPNVKIGKWFPQRDILAHPNLKLFVTQGGLLSTTEAVYHGVPVVGIPIFADQKNNVATSVHQGFAVEVDFEELNEKSLTTAVNEILNNPKYSESVKNLSKILKDRPLKPIDNAVFWVEYVLRHNGAHHLKTSGLKLAWYQYLLLDVIAFLMGIVIAIVLVIYFVTKMLCKVVKNIFFKKDKKSTPAKISKSQKSKLA